VAPKACILEFAKRKRKCKTYVEITCNVRSLVNDRHTNHVLLEVRTHEGSWKKNSLHNLYLKGAQLGQKYLLVRMTCKMTNLVTVLEADLPKQKPIQTTGAPPLSPSSSPGH